jgi:hypothetical protein
MHEVKAALQTNNWDLEAALKELQRQGLTAASKKVLIRELFLRESLANGLVPSDRRRARQLRA